MDDLVAKALHAARQHFDEGGFLDTLRGMFSGPDVQSTGEAASPTNWGDPESAADFFRADKALRLARQASREEPPLTAPLPGAVEVRDLPEPQRRPVIPEAVVQSAPRLSAPVPDRSEPIQPSSAIAYAPGDGKLVDRVAPEAPKLASRAMQGPDLTDRQRDLIIRTIAAETSGKTPEESQAIAHVILNRIVSGKYGASPEAVLFAPKQFEPWANPAGGNYPMRFSPDSRRYAMGQTALEAALANEDITGGATNFWAPKAQAALGRPAPTWGRTGGVDIGETRFHKIGRAEGGEVDAPDGVDQALDVVRREPMTPAALARAWTPPEEAIETNYGPRQRGIMETYPEKLGAIIGGVPGAVAHSVQDPFELAHQAATGQLPPDYFHSDEGIGRALNAAGLAMTGGIGGAPEGAVLGSGPIRAYHGSPHKFDRFDLSKIGTGEGAQGFGHGLYFAEHEPTARSYRDALSDTFVGGQPFSINDPLHQAASILHGDALGNRAKAISITENKLNRDFDPFNEHVLRILQTKKDIPAPVATGHMYDVNIHADPEKLINWNKPLVEQPKAVQELAHEADLSHLKEGNRTRSLIERFRSGQEQPEYLATGQTLHNALSDYGLKSNPELSQYLLDRGHPGIKYLDALSRGVTANPTHNYVIFNDKLIDINRRYAQGGDVEPTSVEDRALMLVSRQA